MRPLRALPAFLLAGLLLASAASAAPTACPHALPAAARCGTVTVPLDRSGAVSGTVDVRYARVPATGPRRGTLALLAGGPGDGATWTFTSRGHLHDFAPARRTHDLVIVDGRGTGRSGALTCSDAPSCASALGAARGLYTTIDTADDLDAVRAAIGVERWSLYGISYGTYDAQVYARRYPARVDRLVLNGVVSQRELDDPFRLAGARALRGALRATCEARACRGVTRDPFADLRAVLHRGVDPSLAGAAVLASDVNRDLRAQLPAALAAARRGDLALLRRLAVVASLPVPVAPAKHSPGLFATAACEEQAVPWERSTPPGQRLAEAQRRIAALPAGAFAPFPLQTAALGVSLTFNCLAWPHAGERRVERGPLPDRPALLINGDADLRTPVSEARSVAAELPHSTLLVARNIAHDVIRDDPTNCTERAVGAFLRGAGVPRCRRAPLRIDPIPPRSRHGLSVRRIARLTVADAVRVVAMRRDAQRGLVDVQSFAGLRGGRVRASGDRVRLTGVEYVRGVRVTGVVDLRGRGHIVARLR